MKSLITPPNKAAKISTQNHKETQNFLHLKTFFAEFYRKNSSRKNSNSKAKSKKRKSSTTYNSTKSDRKNLGPRSFKSSKFAQNNSNFFRISKEELTSKKEKKRKRR